MKIDLPKISPKDMTPEQNDSWFFHLNSELLKLTYEGGQLEKKCELIEKRMRLTKPDNIIKRNSFDPDMKLNINDTLPKWWHDNLKAARGRVYEEKKESRPDEFNRTGYMHN